MSKVPIGITGINDAAGMQAMPDLLASHIEKGAAI